MGEGIFRKISSGKLRGVMGAGWNAAEFYHGLEAAVWIVFLSVLLVKGVTHLLSWLF